MYIWLQINQFQHNTEIAFEFQPLHLCSWTLIGVPGGYNVVSESPEASSTENEQIIEDKQSESEGTESPVSKASQKKDTITWVHIIRYHNHLKRIYNTNLSGMYFYFLLENCCRWDTVFEGRVSDSKAIIWNSLILSSFKLYKHEKVLMEIKIYVNLQVLQLHYDITTFLCSYS